MQGKTKRKQGDIGEPKLSKFSLKELRPAGYNPRVIDDDALAGLAASLKRFGCVEPIVINTRGGKNTIVVGHQRYKVLKSAGAKECICVTVDLARADEKLLNITLNNPHTQGRFIEAIDEYIANSQGELGVLIKNYFVTLLT